MNGDEVIAGVGIEAWHRDDASTIRLNDEIQGILRRLLESADGGYTGDGHMVGTVILSPAEVREIKGVLAWDEKQRASDDPRSTSQEG